MPSNGHQPSAYAYFRDNNRKISPVDSIQSFSFSSNIVALLVIVSLCFILAGRQLYIALDDLNYINYFSNSSDWYEELTAGSKDWWLFVLDEPLWNIYTIVTGTALGPETAFRVTIFASAFLYLYFSARLGKGNWVLTTLLFVLHPSIGAQMYFNQVRQGVALSLFLTLVSMLRIRNAPTRIAIASGVAALIHSSFIIMLAVVTFYVFKPRLRIVIVVTVALVIFAASEYIDLTALVDTGRRQGVYTNTNILNINYYIVTLSAYVAIFYLLWPKVDEIYVSDWYYLTAVSSITSIGLTFVYEAAARLTYNSEAMICILLAKNIKTKAGMIALGVWLFALAIGNISAYFHDASLQDSMLMRWQHIISDAY